MPGFESCAPDSVLGWSSGPRVLDTRDFPGSSQCLSGITALCSLLVAVPGRCSSPQPACTFSRFPVRPEPWKAAPVEAEALPCPAGSASVDHFSISPALSKPRSHAEPLRLRVQRLRLSWSAGGRMSAVWPRTAAVVPCGPAAPAQDRELVLPAWQGWRWH